jgi:hypothetical protein
VKPKAPAGSKPSFPAAGSVFMDGDKAFGGITGDGLHANRARHAMSDNRQQQQQQQAPPPRVNTAAALLQEIKKEREERLSSSGGYPHALRGGSGAADVGPSYTKAPVVGFTDHRLPPQQLPAPDKVTRTQPPSLPWPFNDKARPQSAEGESSADVDTPGGLPALELFSGLHFMKPRVGGGGGAQRSNSRTPPPSPFRCLLPFSPLLVLLPRTLRCNALNFWANFSCHVDGLLGAK